VYPLIVVILVAFEHSGTDESRPRVKEVASMRRILLVLAVALVMAAMVLVLAVPAFAQGRPAFAKPPADACVHLELSPEIAQIKSGCVRG
jgi:hypothetical protein